MTDLLNYPSGATDNILTVLRKKLASLLQTDPSNVDIFALWNVPNNTGMVDLLYAAHGSPYYTPEKLNGLVWANKANVRTSVFILSIYKFISLCQ